MPLDQPAQDLVVIREKYGPLREAQRTLNKRLQTMLPKRAFKECGQRLGFWQHGQLVFDEEDHVGVFTDYTIYDYRLRGGTNAVERLRKLDEVKSGASHPVDRRAEGRGFRLKGPGSASRSVRHTGSAPSRCHPCSFPPSA